MTTTTQLMWAGGATPDRIRPVVKLNGPATSVRAAFSTSSAMTSPVFSAAVAPDANGYVRPGDVTGLAADTRYYWCAEIDGTLDTANKARARTMPTAPTSVAITFASCWSQNAYSGITIDHPVGAACAAQHGANHALAHIFAGDFGYDATASNPSPTNYRGQFETMHAIPNVAALARAVTWDHIWDDHDWWKDNSDGSNPGAANAWAVYRQVVPSYDLPAADAVYHAFTIGSVRYVVTDLRSFRSPNADPDGPGKTMLGATQKTWLKQQWLDAAAAGQFIVWVSSQVWGIDGTYTRNGLNVDGDHWGAFATERAELDNFRSANNIRNIVVLTGDSHSIRARFACDYSDAQNVPMPEYGSAAMSRFPAWRPGAWDLASPSNEGDGHYAMLTVTSTGPGAWHINCDFHLVDPVSTNDTIEFSASRDYNPPSVTRLYNYVGDGTNPELRDSSGNKLSIYTLAP